VPGFDEANTQACEEAFSWLAGAKSSLRNMNGARFNFFILRIIHLRNKELCKMKL